MLTPAVLCLLAYLIGSVPSGYLLIRAIRKVDVRQYGSHSIGAINVCRVGGVWLGGGTLLADAGKALVVVLLARVLMSSPWVIASASILVMTGHAYSLWLFLAEGRFSEGKSVACALGVVFALSLLRAFPWYVAVAPVAVWLTGLVGPRLLTGRWSYISPATMAATVSLPLAVFLAGAGAAYLGLSAAMAVLILIRHRNNVRRLLAGTEPRLGDRLSSKAVPSAPGRQASVPRSAVRRASVQTDGDIARRLIHHESRRHTSRRWAHLRPVRA
jgi:glycerol-3-phosphate acyltransferase PlsY